MVTRESRPEGMWPAARSCSTRGRRSPTPARRASCWPAPPGGGARRTGPGLPLSRAAVSSPVTYHSLLTPLCPEENLALSRPTTQSDILWSYGPDLAVDGDPNTCSFTTRQEGQRWWQVRYTQQVNRIPWTKTVYHLLHSHTKLSTQFSLIS